MNKLLLHCFYVCNSTIAPIRDDYFYPFKARFLAQNASYLGWQRQIVKHKCWTCRGVGMCKDETCYACGGDGIYRINEYDLNQYLLVDRIYHVPQSVYRRLEPGEFNGTIEGIVPHKSFPRWQARLALVVLFAIYDRPHLWLLLRYWRKERVDRHPKSIYCSESWMKLVVALTAPFAGSFPVGFRGEHVLIRGCQSNTYANHISWVWSAWFDRFGDTPF